MTSNNFANCHPIRRLMGAPVDTPDQSTTVRPSRQLGWTLTELGLEWRAPSGLSADRLEDGFLMPPTFDQVEFTLQSGGDGKGVETWSLTGVTDPHRGPFAGFARLLPLGKPDATAVTGTVTVVAGKVEEVDLLLAILEEKISLFDAVSLSRIGLTITNGPKGGESILRWRATITIGTLSFPVACGTDGYSWELAYTHDSKQQPTGEKETQAPAIATFINKLTGIDYAKLPLPLGLTITPKELNDVYVAELGLAFAPASPPRVSRFEISLGLNKSLPSLKVIPNRDLAIANPRFSFWGSPDLGSGGYGCAIDATLAINQLAFTLSLSAPDYEFAAELVTGSNPPTLKSVVSTLLSQDLPGSLGPLADLKTEELSLTIGDNGGYIAFQMLMSGSIVLPIKNISLLGAGFDVRKAGKTLAIGVQLAFDVAGATLTLSGTYSSAGRDSSSLTLQGRLSSRGKNPLTLGKLVRLVNQEWGLPRGLEAIQIRALAGGLTMGGGSAWWFDTTLDWPLSLGSSTSVITAAVRINATKEKSGKSSYDGSLAGQFRLGDLTIGVRYVFQAAKSDFIFTLTGKAGNRDIRFEARVATDKDASTITLGCQSQVNLAELIEALAGLIVPGAPGDDIRSSGLWKDLAKISLQRLQVTLDLTRHEAAVTCDIEPLTIGAVSLSGVGLTYRRRGGKGSLQVALNATCLGQTFSAAKGNAVTWDALSDTPPALPNPTLLDIRYLAVGQRVGLSNQPARVAEGLDRLRQRMRPLSADKGPPVGPATAAGDVLRFDPGSGFLFAADATILDTVTLSILCQDPTFHGVNALLGGKRAGRLAGLGFELLYRGLGDGVGVFSGTFVVPDSFRIIGFGPARLTVGVVSVDIFSNGDFRANLGFPAGGDFSRSFAIDLPTLSGRGGLYVAKLSGPIAATALRPIKGRFDPVLQVGLGLSVGTRKAFSWGPLRGSATAGVTVLLEGIFGSYVDENGLATDARYYKLVGVASINGQIEGEVDFKVISARISVAAAATVTLILEAYERTNISVNVKVAANADVKIGFIRINKSFDLDTSVDVSFGERIPAPWEGWRTPPLLPSTSQGQAREEGNATAASQRSNPPAGMPPAVRRRLQAWMVPIITRAEGEPACTLTLTLSVDDDARGFPALVEGLLEAAIRLAKNPPGNQPLPPLTRADLAATVGFLEGPQIDTILSGNNVWTEFSSWFDLDVEFFSGGNESAKARNHALFAMTPHIHWDMETFEAGKRPTGQPDPQRFLLSCIFSSVANTILCLVNPSISQKVTRDWLVGIDRQYGKTGTPGGNETVAPSMTALIFRDYVMMVMRTAARSALDWHATAVQAGKRQAGDSVAAAEVFKGIKPRMGDIAGMVSSNLLGGTRLTAAPVNGAIPAQPGGSPLKPYTVITGQQKTIDNAAGVIVRFVTGGGSAQDVTRTLRQTITDVEPLLPAAPFAIDTVSTVLPPRRLFPVAFALAQRLVWEPDDRLPPALGPKPAAGSRFVLREFPQDFLRHLTALDRQPGDALLVERNNQPITGPHAWVSLVPLTLRRTADDSVMMMCPAQVPERDRLLALWQDLSDSAAWNADLFLLHHKDGESPILASTWLDRAGSMVLQTGLSTLTVAEPLPSASDIAGELADQEAPAPAYAAPMNRPADFIRMLWRAAITGRGFLLQWRDSDYGGWPKALFADSDQAVLRLLVVARDKADQVVPRHFHNAMLCVEPEASQPPVIVTPKGRRAPQRSLPVLPAGHAGITVRRRNPSLIAAGPAGSPEHRKVQAESLFSLLRVRLRGGDGLREGPERVPETPVVIGDDIRTWVYNPVIPVAPYGTSRLSDGRPGEGLPDPELDPYRGIAVGAKATFELRYFDGFGNPWMNKPPEVTIPTVYFDDLIGPGQWPGLAWSYRFQRSAGDTPQILVEGRFNVQGFNTPDKAEEACRRYEAIYYQIVQPDITAGIRCTIDRRPERPVDLAPLRRFVEDACLYLKEVARLKRAPAPSDLKTLGEVGAGLAINRTSHLPLVADLLEANADRAVSELFAGPVHLPRFASVGDKDPLPNTLFTDKGDVLWLPTVDLPLRPDILIAIPGRSWQQQEPFMTLAALAALKRTSVSHLAEENADRIMLAPNQVIRHQGVDLNGGAEGRTLIQLRNDFWSKVDRDTSIADLAMSLADVPNVLLARNRQGLSLSLTVRKMLTRPGDTVRGLVRERSLQSPKGAGGLSDQDFRAAAFDLCSTGGLLAQGQRVVVGTGDKVGETDSAGSLRDLIGRKGLTCAEFAIANWTTPLRPGALRFADLWEVGGQVSGEGAVRKPPSQKLNEVAVAWEVDPADLAAANAGIARLATRLPIALPAGPPMEPRNHETLAQMARRARLESGGTATVEELAAHSDLSIDPVANNGLLVPPRPFRWTIPLDPAFARTTAPLEVELVQHRSPALVHPDCPEAGICVSRVPPAILSSAAETSLNSFIRRFDEALSPYPLTLALGRAEAGQRQLVVVDKQQAGLLYYDGLWEPPRLFALPSQTVPAGGVPVAVQGLDERTGLPGGPSWRVNPDTEVLERAARHLFETLERCVSPDLAGATHRCNSAAYGHMLEAKRVLADALAGQLIEIHGHTVPSTALATARERVRQELLADLAQAHKLSLLIQAPVSVRSEYNLLADQPRLRITTGRLSPLAMPDSAVAGLQTLRDHWRVDIQAAATLLADIPDLLKVGAPVTCGDNTATVEKGMTLRQLLVRLGGPAPEALTLSRLKTPDGLFNAGQGVPLSLKPVSIVEGDTFSKLAKRADVPLATLVLNLKNTKGLLVDAPAGFTEVRNKVPGGGKRATLTHWAAAAGYPSACHLAMAKAETTGLLRPRTAVVVLKPHACTLATLAADLGIPPARLLDLLADVPGLLLPDATATCQGVTVPLTRHLTLRQLAARLVPSLPDLLTAAVETPFGLFNPGLPLPLVADDGAGRVIPVPPVPCLAGRVSLTTPHASPTTAAPVFGAVRLSLGEGPGTLDIPVSHPDPAAAGGSASRGLTLTVEQLEHDITTVDDSLGYQASHWLHFLQPITHRLKDSPVSLPHPPPPVAPLALDHRRESGEDDGAGQWSYAAAFRIVPEEGDLYRLRVRFGMSASRTEVGTARAALAQYDVLAPRMDSVLLALGGPIEESTRLHDTLGTVAGLAGTVARNWAKPATVADDEDMSSCDITLSGTRDRLTSLEVSAGDLPEIAWGGVEDGTWTILQPPRGQAGAGQATTTGNGKTVLAIDWPRNQPIDLLFTWRKLDLFKRPDALAALSVTRPPARLTGLAGAFATTRGPAGFPVALAATRTRPASVSTGAKDLAACLRAAIDQMFAGQRPDGIGYGLSIHIDRRVAMGNTNQLEVAVPVAAWTGHVDPGGRILAALADDLVAQVKRRGEAEGQDILGCPLRLELAAFSDNRDPNGPPVLTLRHDVAP